MYLGAAAPVFGPVTPANKKWYSAELPRSPHDPARAQDAAGLDWADGPERRRRARRSPGHRRRGSTLLTQKGQTALERGAAVIRDELKKIGLAVDVVPLEGNALVQRFLSGKGYDAVYFHLGDDRHGSGAEPGFLAERRRRARVEPRRRRRRRPTGSGRSTS